MLTGKTKWLGLTLMGIAVLIAITSGALAFKGVISADEAITIIRWCAVIGVPGFILHIVAVIQQWKEKQRSNAD
jgi:hypothetical protein